MCVCECVVGGGGGGGGGRGGNHAFKERDLVGGTRVRMHVGGMM